MKRTWEVADLVEKLQLDSWRVNERPFSEDMLNCHSVLFDVTLPRQDKSESIVNWLEIYQPCLFGQMEAKRSRLSICLLTENDLESSDQDIRRRIEEARVDWRRLGFEGKSHGFLIMAVSQTIAFARPGPELHRLALKICELYLGMAASDEILHDSLPLDIAGCLGEPKEIRSWKVGVNYFSAQGDGRWWHDHRIPGGISFSMNSVGHMARTTAERELTKRMAIENQVIDIPREKLVYWALPKAMKTIGPRCPEGSRGTWLAPHGSFKEDKEPPTYEQRQRHFGDLAAFSPNRCKGFYHTDHTVPTAYFVVNLWKREDLEVRDDLYFTYLHDLKDTDYLSMGLGLDLASETRDSDASNKDLEIR